MRILHRSSQNHPVVVRAVKVAHPLDRLFRPDLEVRRMGQVALIRRSTALVALGVAAAFAAAPAPTSRATEAPATAQAGARRCVPLGGLLVSRTIRRGLRNGGNEVTEKLADGVYRVSRCDRAGTLTSSMTVAPVRDPDGRRVLAPAAIVRGGRLLTLDYGDPRDPKWAGAWRRVRARVAASVTAATRGTARPDSAFNRRNVTGSSVRAAAAPASAETAAQGAATSSCDDGGYLKSGEIWPSHRYGWRWRASSFGSNSDILRAIELGAQAWDLTKDSCDFGDVTTITPVYDGATDLLAGAQDNVSTVDKGNMASFGCEGALACTQVWYTPAGAVEADIRFSDRVKWSTSGKSGAYDYRSVATHEFGHFIGLSDLHDSPNLTMYYATDIGSTGARTLGRGDVLGLRALYP